MTLPVSSRRRGARWHCPGLVMVSFTLSRVITTFWTRLSLTPAGSAALNHTLLYLFDAKLE